MPVLDELAEFLVAAHISSSPIAPTEEVDDALHDLLASPDEKA